MHMRLLITVTMLLAGSAQAASLMATDTGYIPSAHGYGGSSVSQFSSYLDNEFATIANGNLNDLSVMLGYDAIWVTLHDQSRELTAQEASNLTAYIATGRRVLMFGEHDSWDVWNNSMLSMVGATAKNFDPIGCCSESTNAIATHPLLNGVDSIYMKAAGILDDEGSGLVLFDQAVAAVWGDNVLAVLDTAMFAGYISYEDNDRFAVNTSKWLASAVPIPASVWLFGSALGVIGWLRRRVSRQ
jgi:hypothetical protein